MVKKERVAQRRRVVVDKKSLILARQAAKRQPRITFYSPLSSLVLNYLKNVTPRFSISDEVARIVESELARRYPELAATGKKILRLSRGS
ncbi:MAG: hypothetical protein QW059_03380 [Nitrososphaerota archaeon]